VVVLGLLADEIGSEFIPLAGIDINNNDDPTLETMCLTLFVYGCPRRCINCQNPELQTIPKNIVLTSIVDVKKLIEKYYNFLIKSVAFCGGDFLPYYECQLIELSKYCKELGLKTILYTGELYESINKSVKNLIDITVDGPYQNDNKNETQFPPSKNQRVFIDGIQIDPGVLKINNNGGS
jgi:anaerobic ribonucleoside-triphosphate reductase activating protein